MELQSAGLGGIAGIAIWELGKQGFGIITKKVIDTRDLNRKLLREDIEIIADLVSEIHELSVSYYKTAFSSEKAQDLSQQIKSKSKTVGMKIYSTNIQLKLTKQNIIDINIWTVFKQRTTEYLDVNRNDVWIDTDPRILGIYKSTFMLYKILTQARYKSI